MTQRSYHHKAAEVRDQGAWQRFTGKAKETWGDLTDDEMTKYEGKYDQAMGYLKEKYGETVDGFQDWWNEQSRKK